LPASFRTGAKELAEHGEAGRKPCDPRNKEIERLKKANAHLERRAYVAENLVDFQKEVLHLFAASAAFCSVAHPHLPLLTSRASPAAVRSVAKHRGDKTWSHLATVGS